MSPAQLDALADAAMARLALWIARSAAQHQRRMRENWSTNMSCCDYNDCNQGRDCPARGAQAPAKVAVAKPLYRRCDIAGVCPQPDAECHERCLLAAEDGESLTQMETVAIWLVTTLAVGLLLVLLGGVVGYLWGPQ